MVDAMSIVTAAAQRGSGSSSTSADLAGGTGCLVAEDMVGVKLGGELTGSWCHEMSARGMGRTGVGRMAQENPPRNRRALYFALGNLQNSRP